MRDDDDELCGGRAQLASAARFLVFQTEEWGPWSIVKSSFD